MTEGKKEIFKTQSTMIIRSEPSVKGSKERTLPKGALIQGVYVGSEEKIQGKTAKWVAVRGLASDNYVFSGFMTPVTDDYDQLTASCQIEKNTLKCNEQTFTIDAKIQVYVDKTVCGKKPGSMVKEVTINGQGPAKLKEALKKVADDFDVYFDKKKGTAVQVDYYGSPLECY